MPKYRSCRLDLQLRHGEVELFEVLRYIAITCPMSHANNHLYTILGAGGSVGNALAKRLIADNKPVRLVSRTAAPSTGAESVRSDLTSLRDTTDSVKNSHVVFLCAGLAYDIKVWRDLWPKIMTNAIEACKVNNAALIFLDNVYCYGRVSGPMTEETPYNPSSKKGEVRATLAEQLQREMKRGNLRAIIARSADFYGPFSTKTSVMQILVIDRLRKGQKAYWLVNPDATHSFSYVPDLATGLQLLADDETSFNQVWHLPTTNPALTGKSYIEIASRELGVAPRMMVLKKWMLRLSGIADTTIRESYEMLYQSEFDYVFDSSKFNERFHYTPMSYPEGVARMI
jgi:nucleoside-diphosphate-sugar epimerase